MPPHWFDYESVDLAKLRQVDQLAPRPIVRPDRLVVDPVRGLCISLNFEIFPQVLVPDRATLLEKCLYLAEDHGIAFHGRRMMGLLLPDALPDDSRLLGFGQPANFDEGGFSPVKVV